MTRCEIRGCWKPTLESSRFCADHTRERLAPRTPEWVRRARDSKLPVKDYR